jgi:hypothetical protein
MLVPLWEKGVPPKAVGDFFIPEIVILLFLPEHDLIGLLALN